MLPEHLPSGVLAVELGLREHASRVALPLGLVVPEGDDRAALAALRPQPPAWWAGTADRRRPHVVLSRGALSLNEQVRPLLEGAVAARARCLVVVAPAITHEALATLLVNDLGDVFPEGVLPLQVLVPVFHVEEVVDAIGERLGLPVWAGGVDGVRLRRVAAVHATTATTDVRPAAGGLAGSLAAAFRALRRS